MRTESAPSFDPTASVVPAIICNHPDDVASLDVLEHFRLRVQFHDGVSGIVDLSQLVTSPDAGVFARLLDPAAFARATVVWGAVTWPDEIDLAPDAMYAALRSRGEWILT